MPDHNIPHVLWRLTKELGGTRTLFKRFMLLLTHISKTALTIASLYIHTLRLLQSVDVSMTVARSKEYSRWYYYDSNKKEKTSAQKITPPEDEDAQDTAANGEEDLDIASRTRRRLPKRRLAELCPVELRLASAIVVVLKLVYGLDGEPRQPASWEDIACEFPTPSEWLSEIRIRVEGGWFRRHTVDRQPM